ncbi:MAG: UPF0158 family protein [Treponema sp.]|nr:UPF0158 family protein [Treponema sp.]
MRFELDNTLIDDILFHMENQDGEFVLDAQERMVIDINFNEFIEKIDLDDERYVSLPEWSSSDGYHLMESFASSLKNPVVRQELSNALNRNKGVFRAFRDVLDQYPEIEKMWYAYKDQKMKNEVISWYNALREEWGLEPIGSEPEDTSSLVLEDFVIKEELRINGFVFYAETADEDFAGTIEAYLDDGVLCIETLEVEDEYRGLGLGKALLTKLIEKADEENYDLEIDLPIESEYFSRSLLLENFKPSMQRFIRKKI